MAYIGTAPSVSSATTAADQKKYLHAKLLKNAHLKLVCRDICEKVKLPEGHGLTATFVRYQRMNLPQATITEGIDPNVSTFSLATVTVTLDQWGDVLVLSDIAQLTTSHPLVTQALKLLADNAARVMDREVQIVWLAGTNVTYGDGSVATRAGITTGMRLTDTVLSRAYVSLTDGGASPRGGPNGDKDYSEGGESSGSINGAAAYVAVAGPQVMADIRSSVALGGWLDVAMYNDSKRIYNMEVGRWMGIRWVETNFIPKFTMLGSTTVAVASGSDFGAGQTPTVTAVATGGSLPAATTYWYKLTSKLKTRGFEENISIRHSTASAGGVGVNSFAFNFTGLPTDRVYNLYFGTADSDANLFLAASNIESGATVVVTQVPAGVNPPGNVNPTGTPTIHPVYIHGEGSCAWVGLQNLRVMTSKDGATTDNPLELRKTIGYKFLAKTVILNQMFMLRIEVASGF